MISRDFLKAGHTPTLFAAFLYFVLSFMVWVILGPLGVAIAKDFHLDPAQKGLMVAIPVLAGAVLRLVNGVLVDRIGPKKTGMIGQLIVLTGLVLAWFLGIHNYHQVLALGLVLGVAGASFAVALPLASRWYPQEHQGLALGIAGAGNSGTALAALFAPILAKTFGWQNVIGMAAIPLAVAFVIYMLLAKDAPEQPAPKKLAEYGLSPVVAGFFTAACVFAGSFIRPVGGALADRFGGVRTLTFVFALAAAGLAVASFQMPSAYVALAVLMFSMLALGAGNGAVFQLAPQRFRKEIGVMTGLIGMTGGIGGFYLASSLGMAKKMTGSYQIGFLGFAALAVFALVALHSLKARWRAVWPTLHGDSAAPVRV